MEDKLMETVYLRTIQKDIKEMREDTRLAFYAPIEYDRVRRAYRYIDRNYSILQFGLQTNEVNALKFYASCLQLYSEYGIFKDFSHAIQKIINGIRLKNALHKDTDPGLIVQTDTLASSRGIELLEQVVEGIDEKSNISSTYQKYTGDRQTKIRTMSPYLLKEYKNRWYLLGYELHDKKIKTFVLDRISHLKIVAGTYHVDDSFDQLKYFRTHLE